MNRREEERFGELLTEAVHTIKRRTGRPIAVIQDELMYALGRESGNPVEYWRKGHIPAGQSDFIQLARELVARGGLGRDWLRQFWSCTEFVGLADVERELFSGEEMEKPSLPRRPYARLVGRAQRLAEIVDTLADDQGRPMVAIDGMGGIGKTALAYAALEQALASGLFEGGVWVREDGPGPGGGGPGLTYEGALNAIGLGLGLRDVGARGIAGAEERIAGLLRAQKILLVLDNLETAAEPQAEIAERVAGLLGPHSRALLTSRRRFVHGVYHIHLGGLDAPAAAELLRQEAQARGIVHVAQADPDDLTRIVSQTGGSPLALKLAVGQLAYQPAEVVAARFQQVRLQQDETDEYARFYRSIFFPSWGLLSDEGKRLLVSMTHFAPGMGGGFAAVKAASGLATDALAEGIDELWRLAFVEIGEPTAGGIRYYLHPLTRHFVLSDIVQLPGRTTPGSP